MKKTSPLMKILPIAVLAAVLVYFAVQLYNYLSDPVNTTLVIAGQAEDTIALNGWLLRDEEVLPAQSGTLSRVRQEGERVGVGQVLARVYANDGALQTVSQIETLELQLQQLQFALTSYLNPDAALKLDTSITGDILTLRQSLTGGDYTAAEGDIAPLKAAVLKRDHPYASQEEIQTEIKSVEGQIKSLEASLSGTTVTARASGTYSAVCDGYETVLTKAFLEDVTPGKLARLRPVDEQSNMGKLIYGDTWYYVVTLPEEQASYLKSQGAVTLRFAKGFDQNIRMQVVSVSAPEDGQAAVTLSCRKYLAQTTLLRHQAAEVCRREPWEDGWKLTYVPPVEAALGLLETGMSRRRAVALLWGSPPTEGERSLWQRAQQRLGALSGQALRGLAANAYCTSSSIKHFSASSCCWHTPEKVSSASFSKEERYFTSTAPGAAPPISSCTSSR